MALYGLVQTVVKRKWDTNGLMGHHSSTIIGFQVRFHDKMISTFMIIALNESINNLKHNKPYVKKY